MTTLSRRDSWRIARRGAVDALLFPAWTVALALVGVGSLARDVGHSVIVAMVSTLLVWAGPAQVMFFGGLAAGLAPLGIALAIFVSSSRFLPMTMSLLPLVRRPGDGVARQIYLAHLVAVTVWTESLRRLPLLPPEERQPYYLGFAHACIGLSALSTAAGYFLVGALPVPLAAAMLMMTPVYFTISVSAGARLPMDWIAVGCGFTLLPIFGPMVGEGFDLLVVGLVGGTLAYSLRGWRGLRRTGDA